MSMSFLSPLALLLLVLVPAALGLRRSRVHLVLRSLLIVAVVFALAQPVLLRDDGSARQVIVLDQRDWLGEEAKEQARAVLFDMLAQAESDDRIAVVQIGGDHVASDGAEWTMLPGDTDLADALLDAQAEIAPG